METLGKLIAKNKFIFYLLNLTWGLLGTLIGLIVWSCLKVTKHIANSGKYGTQNIYIMVGEGRYGFSIGLTIIVGDGLKSLSEFNKLCSHEIGHCVQNAIYGPFTLFLVYIPSVIRYWKMYNELKKGKITSLEYMERYEKVWFEKQATLFGGYF